MTIPVLHRAEHLLLGRTDLELHRALQRQELVRVAPGAYAVPNDWAGLTDREQHRVRVLEAARRTSTTTIFSHWAAAAIWDLPLLGRWPTVVDVRLERATGGRSGGRIRRHCAGLDGVRIVERDGMLLTSPAQTAVDLARVMPFAGGVAAIDSALWLRRRPAPLATIDDISAVVQQSGRGMARARAAAEFSTGLSDSPEESHSRVELHALGFPTPELQVRFELRDGRTAYPDFYWREFDHAGECDGRQKYRDPRYLRGRRAEDVVIEEKNRENELRRVVTRLSRWEPAELYSPRRFYDRLTRDGLPSTKPRP